VAMAMAVIGTAALMVWRAAAALTAQAEQPAEVGPGSCPGGRRRRTECQCHYRLPESHHDLPCITLNEEPVRRFWRGSVKLD
jgi:hypothetical protein